jgi:hypothetical protein
LLGKNWDSPRVRRCTGYTNYNRIKSDDPDAFRAVFALKTGAFRLSVTQRFTRTTGCDRHH